MSRISALLFLALVIGTFNRCTSSREAAISIPADIVFPDKAKNIIIMIGDGMGLSQLTAALYMNDNHLNIEECQHVGFMNVESADNIITDSAAGATAFASGKKTNNNMLSVSPDKQPLKTIFQEGKEKGLRTGAIVTSSIVHATPAAFITNHPFRWFYEEIAASYLMEDTDLLIGGGKRYFTDRERDDRNLLAEFTEKGYRVEDSDYRSLRKIETNIPEKLIYFTHENQPGRTLSGRNYLPEATAFGLKFLENRSEKGFLLLVEGSQIDMAAHHWEASEIIAEVKDFDEAVGHVLKFILQDKETLLIVTADHETAGMSILRDSKMGKLKINFATNAHTPQIVPVYAIGPGAELFNGFYDNTDLYYRMRRALGWN